MPAAVPVAAFLPIAVVLSTLVGVAFAMRLRPSAARWPWLLGAVVLVGGFAAAIAIRAIEAVVIDVAVGQRMREVEAVRRWLVAFGIVGPLNTLGVAAIVWPALLNYANRDEVDPPLLAAVGAAGLVLGRVALQIALARLGLGTGMRPAVLALGDVSLAMTWAYGLSLSSLDDGHYGGTPFGRYAISAMVLRGWVDVAARSHGSLGLPVALGIDVLALLFALAGLFRLRRVRDAPPDTREEIGHETMRQLARSQLRRGRLRTSWIVVGAIADLGGIVLGFVAAVLIGHSAKIDFGEIDRNGPAHDYAALLLALGVIVSFPITAAIVGLASGGREAQRAHVLEAGLSAMIALGVLLVVLGVVAPIAVALGIACAPIAFVLAGVGAWVAAGRRA